MQGIFRERPILHNQNHNRKRRTSCTSLAVSDSPQALMAGLANGWLCPLPLPNMGLEQG